MTSLTPNPPVPKTAKRSGPPLTRHLRVVPSAVALAVVLSSCTSDSSPQSAAQPPETAVVQTSAAAIPTQSSGGVAVTSNPTARTIVVHGIGKKSQAPDQVTVTMGVETVAPTAADALKANNAKATELIKTLKERGVEDRHLQTSQLSIYPQYDQAGRRITGYTVSNIVTATLKDIKGAGSLIDAAASVAGDAIRVQNLAFSLSDSAEALKVARERAVADGRTQAEQLSAAAGVKLGALRTISTSSMSMASPLMQQNAVLAKSADAASVPLEAGAQEVVAEVDLVFDLE